MSTQETRYDRIAEGYAAWWSPVHRPATLRLLDEVAQEAGGTGSRMLDVGCGTGALAVQAARRWPDLWVDGADVSAGMLAVATRTLDAAHDVAGRIRLHRAPADQLPFPDAAFEAVVSAFVLQLVPSRLDALREMVRVLRPGGRLAIVAWLAGSPALEADAAWDAALDAAGIDHDEDGSSHDDMATADAAAAELRQIGIADATAREDRLVHQFTPESYAAFITKFDDGDFVAGLEPAARDALVADLLVRLGRLPEAGLRMELPIAYASGTRR